MFRFSVLWHNERSNLYSQWAPLAKAARHDYSKAQRGPDAHLDIHILGQKILQNLRDKLGPGEVQWRSVVPYFHTFVFP